MQTSTPQRKASRKVSIPATVIAVLLLVAAAVGAVATPIVCAQSWLAMGIGGLFGGSGKLMLATLGSACALALPLLFTVAGFVLTLMKRARSGITLALFALFTTGALLIANSYYFDVDSPFQPRPQIDPSAIGRVCGDGHPPCGKGYQCIGTMERMQCRIQCRVENECPVGSHCRWDAAHHYHECER